MSPPSSLAHGRLQDFSEWLSLAGDPAIQSIIDGQKIEVLVDDVEANR
jgi:hypothetical protein